MTSWSLVSQQSSQTYDVAVGVGRQTAGSVFYIYHFGDVCGRSELD